MELAFFALFLFLILVIAAIRVGVRKEPGLQSDDTSGVLHKSGVYSVVKASPREETMRRRPTREEVRQYLAPLNEDSEKQKLSEADKEALLVDYFKRLDENLTAIEKGDNAGTEFYSYDFDGPSPISGKFVKSGHFIRRDDIYQFSDLIPPFHIGCTCRLKEVRSNENLHETTELRMQPFMVDQAIPSLPDWRQVYFPPELRSQQS